MATVKRTKVATGDKAVGKEVGSSGLPFSKGGTIEEEIHPNLVGRKAIETYRNMSENDPVIAAILFAIDMLCRQVDWSVEQGEASEDEADFLKSCMDDMSQSWGDFVSEAMSMLRFGFSYHEIVYKKRNGPQPEGSNEPTSRFSDGKIGWRKLPMRAQETLDHWDMDDTGSLKGFVQKAPPDYNEVTVPIIKSMLFRTTSYKNNPEGKSLLRGAYRPWFFKKRIEEIEGTGIERDLAGFPVIGLPAAWLADTASAAEKAMVNVWMEVGKNIRRDKQEFLIKPKVFDEQNNELVTLELLSSGGTRTFDTTTIIQRYDQRIAMTVLADFILLGHEKVGSFALSSDKTDLFAVAIGTVLDVIEDVLNRFAVPRLWEINGLNMEQMPQLKHGDIEQPDLAELGAFLQVLSGIGMPLFPDDDLSNFLREVANLPEQSEDSKKMQEGQANGAPGQTAPGQPQPNQPQPPGQPGGPGAGQQPPAQRPGFFGQRPGTNGAAQGRPGTPAQPVR